MEIRIDMKEQDIYLFTERVKELECIYAIDDILQNKHDTISSAMKKLISVLPSGFQDMERCIIKITLNAQVYQQDDINNVDFLNETPILVEDQIVGNIQMGYRNDPSETKPIELMDSEVKLLNAVSSRITNLLLNSQRELSIVFDLIQSVDPNMLVRICEKFRAYLRNNFNGEADDLLSETIPSDLSLYGEVNIPLPKQIIPDILELGNQLVARATAYLPASEVYDLVNGWLQEERLFSIVKAVGDKDSELSDILDAVRRYSHMEGEPTDPAIKAWLIAELAHRFLTDDEQLLHHIQDNLVIEDFKPLIKKIIGSRKSEGNIGGKGAGLFIAEQILKSAAETDELLADIRTPRTWYLATDLLDDFLRYNHMEEMNAYKYNTISYLRTTYDHVVNKIKNGNLPLHTVQMLELALEDLKGTPIIVRSSSLLEDRSNSTFSGKYKSLFLPNQGTKEQCLKELINAVLEVFSSQYNPDSLQYRQERQLINYKEQMGVLIQEVVGTKIGPYYMPLFAGVAFSENSLRWSTRVERESGLVRMVMGLGTRAVDRVNDDYPMLFSPGQPGLRINQSPDDIKHYSPKYIDLINLEQNQFETVPVTDFLKEWGAKVPKLHKLVSVYHSGYMQVKNAFLLSPKKDDMVVTFEGILSDTNIPDKIKRMLSVLSQKLHVPVDIEFAYDGESIVLLQCRAMGRGNQQSAAPIPENIPQEDILFTANRFISDGKIDQIPYVVYVDGEEYHDLSSREELLSVGKAVGLLNDTLPQRKFVLIGPGRWGSRGDIKLGVRVTYADICNTVALIEVAHAKHSYVPELSFGTHFFQDLVEANIAYLPLYPDQKGIIFKDGFFKSANNLLGKLLPEYAHLSDTIKVVDLRKSYYQSQLCLYMNAKLEKAVAFLSKKKTETVQDNTIRSGSTDRNWTETGKDQYWHWRKYMANELASEMDFERYGVKGIYLFGSTDTETAGMGSDIDLIIHINGSAEQTKDLTQWLNGWSKALAKINYLRTGYMAQELLDVHYVTDEDIENKQSYAERIHSITEPVTALRVK